MTTQTEIEKLKPYMAPGYVAMDANGKWCWFKYKPHILGQVWVRDEIEHPFCWLSCLCIKQVEDWKQSLIKID